MALVNDSKKEINAKIVYVGPKGAGKDTALRAIYKLLRPECRSELKCLTSGGHRMLFFDFTCPATAHNDGYAVRFHLYTMLSDEGTSPPWKMLLKGADGIVFLADSTDGRMFGNLESCALLYDAFAHYGVKDGDLPLSLQCNKRDLADALPLAVMKRELFPEMSEAPLPVTALSGEGLLVGLDSIVSRVLKKLGREGGVPAIHDGLPERTALFSDGPDRASTDPAGHCPGDNSGFVIESAGVPVSLADGRTVIPLRLLGGECGKSVDFKVTVAVSL
jgi:signal recognition particle receptor subunit beta